MGRDELPAEATPFSECGLGLARLSRNCGSSRLPRQGRMALPARQGQADLGVAAVAELLGRPVASETSRCQADANTAPVLGPVQALAGANRLLAPVGQQRGVAKPHLFAGLDTGLSAGGRNWLLRPCSARRGQPQRARCESDREHDATDDPATVSHRYHPQARSAPAAGSRCAVFRPSSPERCRPARASPRRERRGPSSRTPSATWRGRWRRW
jgi:hypothetical protein